MKDIPGYEGLYSVTSCGKVWSWKTNKFLKPKKEPNGYLRVTLTDEAGNRKMWLVHRLVAMTYIPNPENLPQVNHKDENKENNCLQNLEWCSAQYNIDYSKSKSIKCVETGEIFKSTREAARKLNLHHSHICSVLKGRYQKTGNLSFIYLTKE